jgi:hypothetical protein
MELPKSFFDEGVRSMYDAARQRQLDRTAAISAKLEEQKVRLQEEHDVKIAQLNQFAKELPPDSLKYPAVLHDIERERAIIEANYMRQSAALNMFGRPSGEIQQGLKILDKHINERFGQSLKDFQETEQFKVAKENASKLQDVNERINLVTSSVEQAKRLIDENKIDAALRHMRTTVIKPLNSILSNDAIQLSEMLIRYRDLLTAPEAAQLGGKSAFNPTVWINQYVSQSDPNKQEELVQSAKQWILDVFERGFSANPKRFLQTAVDGVNGYMEGHNKMVEERVINTSSPGEAERLGIKKFNRIQLEQPLPQFPTVFPPTNIPFGAQPVQGGSTQMPAQVPATGPTPAPAQTPAPTPQPSIDDILKQFGVIP